VSAASVPAGHLGGVTGVAVTGKVGSLTFRCIAYDRAKRHEGSNPAKRNPQPSFWPGSRADFIPTLLAYGWRPTITSLKVIAERLCRVDGPNGADRALLRAMRPAQFARRKVPEFSEPFVRAQITPLSGGQSA